MMLSFTSRFNFAVLSLSSIAAGCWAATELETKYPQLGTNSLEDLSYDFDITVDEDCEYTLVVTFMHNPEFDVGSKETCEAPGVLAEYNGLPLRSSWLFYEEYPEYVTAATNFQHLSLDYNPCGHPEGGWLSPHYDLHFYMVTPQFRAEEVVCDTIPGLPVCDPSSQSTENGKLFFDLERVSTNVARQTTDEMEAPAPLLNMPAGYTMGITHGANNMGMHCFDQSMQPATPGDWMDPSLIFVSHGEVICFEPMVPFIYVAGDVDQSFSQDIVYVEQTIPTLPSNYDVQYDVAAGLTTLTIQGKSNVCQADFEEAKAAANEVQGTATPTPGDGATTCMATFASILGAVVSSAMLFFW